MQSRMVCQTTYKSFKIMCGFLLQNNYAETCILIEFQIKK